MSSCDFKIKVEERISFIIEKDTMNIDDAIDMVRLFNTISHNEDLQKNENNKSYLKLFFGHYSEASAKLLKALPTKGMAYYSKDFDIYIGGPPHSNSMYNIIKD